MFGSLGESPFVGANFIDLLCLTTDINECDKITLSCDSNASCTSSNGSFSCSCNDGYTGDGMTCSGK